MANNYNENAIREAAYYIWQNSGCPSGMESQHWAMAIDQLYNKKNSCCNSSTSKKCSSTSSKKSSSTCSKKTASTSSKTTSKKSSSK